MRWKVIIETFADRFPETSGMFVSLLGWMVGLATPSFNEVMQNVTLVCSAMLSVVTIYYIVLKAIKTRREIKNHKPNGNT